MKQTKGPKRGIVVEGADWERTVVEPTTTTLKKRPMIQTASGIHTGLL